MYDIALNVCAFFYKLIVIYDLHQRKVVVFDEEKSQISTPTFREKNLEERKNIYYYSEVAFLCIGIL